MRDQPPAPANALANLIMLLGFALLLVGGILAYPSLRESLDLDVAPQGFGSEAALGAAIVQAGESLPQSVLGAPPAQAEIVPPPAILPETPLQEDMQAAQATLALTSPPADPAPTVEPTSPPADPAPTIEPTPASRSAPAPTPTSADFAPDVPSRLTIPAIGLDAPVETVGWSVKVQNGQQVSMWDVPNRFAAGWLKTSARAGERGNTVLDGHHNIAGEVFRDLVQLKAGDTIQLWVGSQSREYIVSLLKILPERGQPIAVRLENARWIQPTKDERVTLVTCWPYTNNTHRLIVVALPADAPPPPDLGAE
ncbi:MAG TPA: sortase [Anaerolineae bacterium]|nr:sortase [Anaerolineae bacterium]